MAYNNYYPQFYQPSYQQNPVTQQNQNQVQALSNGFVPVPSEMVARNYPVGYGQSVSFKDENAPYLYTKTMGFSQLEPPIFEKYRLVKEESNLTQNETKKEEPIVNIDYIKRDEFDAVLSDIEGLKKDVESLKEGV